jgi:hypothetical protein
VLKLRHFALPTRIFVDAGKTSAKTASSRDERKGNATLD